MEGVQFLLDHHMISVMCGLSLQVIFHPVPQKKENGHQKLMVNLVGSKFCSTNIIFEKPPQIFGHCLSATTNNFI
jgi:hypothetical protein